MDRQGMLPLLLLLASGCLQLSLAIENPWLYWSTESLGPEKTAGLYAGEIDIWVNGTASNLTKHGIYCANLRSAGFHTGIKIQSMAYDPVTESAVVELQSSGRMTVFTTEICKKGPPKCRDSKVKPLLTSTDPYYSENSGDKTTVGSRSGPFAMWNNSVYFIVNIYYPIAPLIEHRIELRHLEKCEKKYPFSAQSPINLYACSTLVAIMASEELHDIGVDIDDQISSSGHLFIFNKGEEKIFVTQINNATTNDEYTAIYFSMMLVAYRQYEQDPVILHTEVLPNEYADPGVTMKHMGGISYKDGMICWSAFDRILCAAWDGEGPLKNIIRVLTPGMASQVCECRTNYEDLNSRKMSGIVTGVTIGDAKNNLINLFFGCASEVPREGGAGFIRIHKDGSKRQIFRVTDNAGPIYASTMFLGCHTKHLYASAAGITVAQTAFITLATMTALSFKLLTRQGL